MRQLNLPMPIWDLPTRLFHWVLVLLIGFMWLSGKKGWLEYHMLSGYAILALLLFRIVWGFIGSDTARFAFFLKSPIEALRHLSHLTRREPDTEVGHNAAGGYVVVVMLAVLLFQVFTGLCANDDISTEGPLARVVGQTLSDQLTRWHNKGFLVIQLLVAAHIVAIILYAILKRHDLVRPMITGKKRMPGAMRAPRMVSPVAALATFIVASLLVTALVRWVP